MTRSDEQLAAGSSSPSKPGWRYQVLIHLAAVPLLLHASFIAVRSRSARFLFQRLGFSPKSSAVHWWHAASVGEVQTAWPLLNACINQESGHDPRALWVVTTNTTTGFEVLTQRLEQANLTHRVTHAYCPVDTPNAVKRFIRRVRPIRCVVTETEVWPNWYCAMAALQIPVTVVNARVTKKTLATVSPTHKLHRALRPAYQAALAEVQVLARSSDDANGFLSLGAHPDNTQVIGDLKFADNRPANCVSPFGDNPTFSNYWVAASTHEPEELWLAEQWIAQSDAGLLVLVPRHVTRAEGLQKNLKERFGDAVCQRRSEGGYPQAHHRLYVADTIGELHNWYAGAAAAFVGGSLIERGGHNVLEPYFHAVPVVTGIHTQNFTQAVQWLSDRDAIHVVDSAEHVIGSMLALHLAPKVVTPVKPHDLITDYLTQLTQPDVA